MALKKQVKSFLVLFDIFILISWLSPALCGSIFFWTDDKGIRHYSNVLTPSSAKNMQTYTEKESNQQPYTDTESTRQNSSTDTRQNNTTDDDTVEKGSLSAAEYNQTGNNIIFKVLKIYDGDTIKVAGAGIILMIRLIGIDAPESGKRNSGGKQAGKPAYSWSAGGQPFGQKAKEALSRMVEGENIHIKSYGTDRYNRLLAEVFTSDNTLVNLQMVKLGMAEVYKGSIEKGFDSASYNKAEAEAKRGYLGIWSLGVNYQSPKVWRKNNSGK